MSCAVFNTLFRTCSVSEANLFVTLFLFQSLVWSTLGGVPRLNCHAQVVAHKRAHNAPKRSIFGAQRTVNDVRTTAAGARVREII